jgi:hypothetical protein
LIRLSKNKKIHTKFHFKLFIAIEYMLKNEIIKPSVKYFLNKIELNILKYF